MRRRHAWWLALVTLAAACKKEPAPAKSQSQSQPQSQESSSAEPAPEAPPPKPWTCPHGTEKIGDAGRVHIADCMPPTTNPACSGEYGEWLKKNCPGGYVTW